MKEWEHINSKADGVFTKVPASLIVKCIVKLQDACKDSIEGARIISVYDAYVHVSDCPD